MPFEMKHGEIESENAHGSRSVLWFVHAASVAIQTDLRVNGLREAVTVEVSMSRAEAVRLVLELAPHLGIFASPQPVEVVGHDKGLKPSPEHLKAVRSQMTGEGGGC